MLKNRPELASNVRTLKLQPGLVEWAVKPPEKPFDEIWIADRVKDLADNLKNLEVFVWDGIRVPFDGIWKKLRLSCVLLPFQRVNG